MASWSAVSLDVGITDCERSFCWLSFWLVVFVHYDHSCIVFLFVLLLVMSFLMQNQCYKIMRSTSAVQVLCSRITMVERWGVSHYLEFRRFSDVSDKLCGVSADLRCFLHEFAFPPLRRGCYATKQPLILQAADANELWGGATKPISKRRRNLLKQNAYRAQLELCYSLR